MADEPFPEAWQRCREWIAAALEHADGGFGIDDIAEGIAAGRFHFWPGERCAVVTEFWTGPRLKTLNFWLLGGDLKELLAMRPDIEAWAIAQGCKRALGGGVRPEWGRVLAKAGYTPRWTIFAKELSS